MESPRGSPGERFLGFKSDKAAHAEDLKSILGGLKGPLMKVAQFLSTIPDALPDEYAAELAQLQANAPAMGWSFVKRRMAGELGPDWQSRFAAFSQVAAAAASLGQVHRARLLDGTEVACKLQYPDMASTVEADSAPAPHCHVAVQADGSRHPVRRHLYRAGRAPAGGAGLPAGGPRRCGFTA